MSLLNPPFVASDRGDVYVYDDLSSMYARIEALDAPGMDLFDATGRPLQVLVEGYSWTVDPQRVEPPDPDRLVGILRRYFSRLPEEFSDYAERAAAAPNLDDLVHLRQDLAREPAPGLWAKVLRRSWR
jgi:hypothetical protein